jgi:hypothetical protein
MLHLQFFDFDQGVVFEVSEVLLPLIIEVLQLSVTNLDILSQLTVLDVFPKLILVFDDVLLELTNFTHKVLEHLILEDVAKLLSKKLHLGFDKREN